MIKKRTLTTQSDDIPARSGEIYKKIYKCNKHGKKIKSLCWACGRYQCCEELVIGHCNHKKEKFDAQTFKF